MSPYEILTNYNAKSALATSQKPVVTVAAPLTVNTTSDSANPGTGLLTLRQAIALAEGNAVNTIQFAPTLNGQIITLNSGITITGNVNIVGPGSGNLTIYDAGTGTYGSFVVNPGVKASVSGLTFSGGFANYGGAFENSGALTLNNDVFSGNHASNNGGAINNEANASLFIANSTFSGNAAAYGGAILANAGSSVILDGDTFTNNIAYNQGGAIYTSIVSMKITGTVFSFNSALTDRGGAIFNGSNSTISIDSSTFLSNSALNYGGAIDTENGRTVITNTSFTRDKTAYRGGAILNNGSSSMILTGDTFTGNSASSDGGAILNLGASLTVNSSVFTSNTASSVGGVLYTNGGTVNISGSTFSTNSASYGGVIYGDNGLTLHVDTSTFDSNTALVNGGAVETSGTSNWFGQSTFSNNSVTTSNGHGGAAFFYNSSLTLSEDTFAGNTAPSYGGAMSIQSSYANIINDTIAYNSATLGGGGIDNFGGSSTIRMINTILSLNTGGGAPNFGNGVISLGFNLVDNTTGSSGFSIFNDDILNQAANLNPLADNGGPTKTILPKITSPALQAGDPANAGLGLAATDQRGFSRLIFGFLDIGSVENQDSTGDGVRGILAGSTVFFDANFNGVLDNGEPSAVTGADGSYLLNINPAMKAAGGQFVLVGGTDLSTGLANVVPLTAPSDYRVIDPFSSLVNALVRGSGMTEAAASARVLQTLGLPSNINLATYNPIAQLQSQDPRAPKVFAAEVRLDQTINMIAALIAGAPGAPTESNDGTAAYNQLAAMIAGGTFDPVNSANIATLISQVATASGVSLSPAAVNGAAQVIAAVNQANAATTLGDATSTAALVQIQEIAEGAISTQLGNVASGNAAIATVVSANTGANLQSQINAAVIGTIVPAALNISDVSAQSLSSGDTVYNFTVTVVSVPTTTQSIAVNYKTHDETAIAANGDYDSKTGTLTWAAGDTTPRTISIIVHGEASPQPNKLFDVQLYQSHGAMIAKGVGAGTIIAASYATTTTLTESAASTNYGQGVDFTAHVTADPAAGSLAGATVVFKANGGYLGTATVDANGDAILSGVNLPIGNFTITATVKASDLLDASSATVAETVILATPTITLSPINVPYDATTHGVRPDVFSADGTIDLGAATITYGTPDGSAPIHPGTYSVTASFAGNANYAAVTVSSTITITPRSVSIVMFPVRANYDGTTHAATAEVYAFDGTDLGAATLTYNTPDGSVPVDAGTYTATATYASLDYGTTTATTTVTIAQIAPTIVACPHGRSVRAQRS